MYDCEIILHAHEQNNKLTRITVLWKSNVNKFQRNSQISGHFDENERNFISNRKFKEGSSKIWKPIVSTDEKFHEILFGFVKTLQQKFAVPCKIPF